MFLKKIKFNEGAESFLSELRYKWYCFKRTIPYYYRISEYYWKLRSILINQQAWMLDGIGREFRDKTHIIPQVLFNSIVQFIEKEKALEVTDWDSDPQHAECAVFLRDCYNYIKVERPALQNKIDKIIHDGAPRLSDKMDWNIWLNDGKSYDERYPKLAELEDEFDRKEINYMMGICKYHEYLWT